MVAPTSGYLVASDSGNGRRPGGDSGGAARRVEVTARELPEDLGEIVAAGALLHAEAASAASAAHANGPITASNVARYVSSVVGKVLGSTP